MLIVCILAAICSGASLVRGELVVTCEVPHAVAYIANTFKIEFAVCAPHLPTVTRAGVACNHAA